MGLFLDAVRNPLRLFLLAYLIGKSIERVTGQTKTRSIRIREKLALATLQLS
jgi:hypothetical protein